MSNLWRIELVGEGPNLEAIVNTFHYDDPTGTAIGPTASAVAGAFATEIAPTILLALSSSYAVVLIRATCQLGDAVGVTAEDFSLAGNVGGITNPPGSIVECGIVQKKSGIAGRRGRGRNFYSPTDAGYFNVDGRFFDTDGLFADIGATLLLGLSVGVPEAWSLGCLAAYAEWPTAIYYMTDYGISPIMGVQRRRRIRAGT